MAKKVKTPMQVAIDALHARHEELFNSALRFYQPPELLSEQQRAEALEHRGKLAGLNEAMSILRKLDAK